MNKKISSLLTGTLSLLLILGLFIPGSAIAQGDATPVVDRTADITRQIPYHKNNTPNRLVATIHGDPAHARGFNWFTSDKFEDSYIEVSKTSDFKESKKFTATIEDHTPLYIKRIEDGEHKGEFYYYYVRDNGEEIGHWEGDSIIWEDGVTEEEKTKATSNYSHIKYMKPQEYAYKAKATDLDAETHYYYRAVSGENVSHVGSFKTSSERFKPFSVIHYTDTQVFYGNQHSVDESWYANDTLRAALEKVPNTDLVLHAGDIVEYSDAEDEWYDLLEQSKEHLSKVTFAPVSGNHDCYSLEKSRYNDSVNFNRHLNVPVAARQECGSYYSYDYNGAHFTMINSNEGYDDGYAISDEQFDWIEQDVKAAKAKGAKWTVLAFHKPIFSGSYHSLHDSDVQNIRHRLMKLIDDLDIDLVMWGHDHILARTHGMRYKAKEASPRLGAYVSDVAEKDDNGVYTYKNPKGTFFVLPSTAGTKVYVNRFNKGLDYLKSLRYRFKDMTQAELDEYNSFMPLNIQHAEQYNRRNSIIQNFATYDFEEDKLTCNIWEVEGKKGAERKTTLVDTFVIDKAEEKKSEEPSEKTPAEETTGGYMTVVPIGETTVKEKPTSVEKADDRQDPKPTQVFEDIENHWGKAAILKGANLGYFKGTSPTHFSPNTKATRAEFMTVLYRLSGQKAKGGQTVSDVKEGDFYYEPVQWGLEKGIVEGYADGSFKGESQITREEMALMLARFLKCQGKSLKEAKETTFADQAEIADWAEEAVGLVVANEILQGRENHLFAPKKTFTRAEMATVTMRLLDK